jgi:hypothetical protein
MLLDIPPLVHNLVPGAHPVDAMSLACVHTTRPKYLIFTGDSRRPAYVVQFGPGGELQRTHRTLTRLYAHIPDAVAESLVCASVGEDEYVHIQTGLPGTTWFRVADNCHSRADWIRLLRRCVNALGRLQAAIGTVPEWTGTVHPAHELLMRMAASSELQLTGGLSLATRWADALDRLGVVASTYQHGDFSINNLLIGESEIGIIDFDEFGETMMPLHDEIGLALSLPLSQEGTCPLTAGECLELCIAPALSQRRVTLEAVPGLVLHHVLMRIEQCGQYPTRAALRARLASYLRDLLATPNELLGFTATGARQFNW